MAVCTSTPRRCEGQRAAKSLLVKARAVAFAWQHSPGITIDLFAGATTQSKITWYAAWTGLVDAFSARNWEHLLCVCCKTDRETEFSFRQLSSRTVMSAEPSQMDFLDDV